MPKISIWIVLVFSVHVIGQFIAVSLLPTTRGFTAVGPTIITVIVFIVALAAAAKVVASGVNLSLLVPMSTVVLQICVLGVAIVIYKEPTSAAKVVSLIAAAGLVAFASRA
jgi:hypothetical protein